MPHSCTPKSFITDEKQVDWWGSDQLSQYYCIYSPQFFEYQLFDRYHLECPADIANAVDKRKSDFLAGRYCAKKVLQRFGLRNFPVNIGPDRNPLWPNGLLGSISHTDHVATAVASDDRRLVGLGVDMERIIRDGPMNETKAHILTASEHRLFESTSLSSNELFTIVFSLKESFFKAAYPLVNRYFGFEVMSIVSIDMHCGTVVFRLNETLHDLLSEGDVLSGQFRFIEEDLLVTLVLLGR